MGNKEQAYLSQAFRIFQQMKKDTKDGFVMRMRFMKTCADKWKVSMPTVSKYLDKFRGFGKLKEWEQGNVKYIKVEM